MSKVYERRHGQVKDVDIQTGVVHIRITTEVLVELSATAFVGGLVRRLPEPGDAVIVSFMDGTAVSGRVIPKQRAAIGDSWIDPDGNRHGTVPGQIDARTHAITWGE